MLPLRSRSRAAALAVFLLLFCSFAYFYQAGGWNQNSRFALVRAITDRGTLNIDPFQRCTGDRALWRGHFYSDKAPGLSLLAVPVVAAARPVLWAAHVDPESYTGIAALSYLATVATTSLAVALAGVCLFFVARRLGASSGGAMFAALVMGLATPMWVYATLFIGHAMAASCLIFAFTAALSLRTSEKVRRDLALGVAVGLSAGWATVTEFPAVIPAGLIVAFAIHEAWTLGSRRLVRVTTALTLAGTFCAGVLMLYQWACFGSPFHLSYASEEGFKDLKEGFFGLHAPSLGVLGQLLFGQYRGLLPLSPVVAFSPFGLLLLLRDRAARAPALLAAAIATFYILLNAGYFYWEGGWSYGPRHLSPALPFLCLGLAPLWSKSSKAGRTVLVALALFGVALTLVAVSTMPQLPADFKHPVTEFLWPAFRAGKLSMNTQDYTQGGARVSELLSYTSPVAWNIGQRWLGLRGYASLVPLLGIWVAVASWLWVRLWKPVTRVPARLDPTCHAPAGS